MGIKAKDARAKEAKTYKIKPQAMPDVRAVQTKKPEVIMFKDRKVRSVGTGSYIFLDEQNEPTHFMPQDDFEAMYEPVETIRPAISNDFKAKEIVERIESGEVFSEEFFANENRPTVLNALEELENSITEKIEKKEESDGGK
jgi:hypothetical protein